MAVRPAAKCSGVPVSPGTDLQHTINAHPPGTTFCFSAGTYVVTKHVRPRSGDRLISTKRRAAVLTGLGRHDGGIVGTVGNSGEHDVLVQGFVIKRFANPWPTFPRSPLQAGLNWTIRDNEISYNSQAGVSVSSGTRLVGNWIHHNGRYGISGGPLTNLLVTGNDVSFNNTAHYNPSRDAGGAKITKSSNVVFRGNRIHDNYGNGLWCDTQNIHVTYERNAIGNNFMAGIFHETSADAVIRNNVLAGNGRYAKGHSLWWSADVLLNDSKNVQIYGNTIRAGVHGISLVDTNRGSNAFGLLEIRNVKVHDNTITLPAGGASGMVSSRTNPYRPRNNSFTRNTYHVTNSAAASWSWPPSGTRTWTQWRNSGNDVKGTLKVT